MPEPAMLPSNTQVPPLLAEEAGALPSRLVWRALALVLDTLLASVAAMVILSTVVFPQSYPNAEQIFQQQMQSLKTEMHAAMDQNRMPDFVPSDDYLDLSETISKTLFMVFLVYFAGSEITLGGTTLGKKVFGLRAARWGSIERPTAIESLSRNIFKAASLVWLLLLVANVITVFLRPSRRAIHDYLARTIVTGAAAPPAPPRNQDDED